MCAAMAECLEQRLLFTALQHRNPVTLVSPAVASIDQAASASAVLTVRGSDSKAGADLRYSWSADGEAPWPVTFSINRTNAARNTTAVFSAAGTYRLRVAISDPSGHLVRSQAFVDLTSVATSVQVWPGTADIAAGGTQAFSADVFDQFGNLMSPGPPVTWSVASGGGAISPTGLYTAGESAGNATVAAQAGGATGASSVTIEDPTLDAWFRADSIHVPTGIPISVWNDSSGHNHLAEQTVQANQPRMLANVFNGKPALRFDAGSQTQLSFPRPVQNDFTIMVVFRSTQGIGHTGVWYRGAGLVDGDVAGVANDFGLSLNSLGQVDGGTGNPDTFVSSGMGFNDGRLHVATFIRNGTTGSIQLYVDGRSFGSATGGTQPLANSPRLTIGSLQTNGGYFTGDIAEVRVYGAALADVQRQRVEGGLRSEYAIAAPPPAWFTNPVLNQDFPDPGAIQTSTGYYAFATNSRGRNVQEAFSRDLVHWKVMPDALPKLPSWAGTGATWGPDGAQMPGGTYNLYFSAHNPATNKESIGVATSSNPAGPYTPQGTVPLVDQPALGGDIDPTVFTDATGVQYLLWKNDGNSIGADTWLWAQQLFPDGLSLVGSPTKLIKEDQGWEGSVVEAPDLWKHGSKYYLFYSANNYGTAMYAIGYAEADSLFGPYVKPTGPMVVSEGTVVGPGGEKVIVGPDGNTWMLYHSWESNFAYRSMSVDQLDWVGDVPVLRGPSRVVQPLPPRRYIPEPPNRIAPILAHRRRSVVAFA